MAKLTKVEKQKVITDLKYIASGSADSDEIRKKFFAERNIEKMRLWCDINPGIKLTRDELDIIYKKYKSWDIFKTIITHQRQLTSDEIIKFYESLKTTKNHLWMTMLMNSKVDDEYRIKIADEYFNYNNSNYHRQLLEVLDREITSNDKIYTKILENLMRYINGNNKNSKSYAKIWAETEILNLDMENAINKISSLLLYEETGLEQYIPEDVKDIFIF